MPAERSDQIIYLRVLWPLVLAMITLVLVSVGGFQVLSAARAYVGGESLWSKARSQAVAQLRMHLSLGSEALPCRPLNDLLSVPLGDQAARLALEQPTPNLDAARAGFLQGGNHPDDLFGLIQLYLVFGSSPLLHDSIVDWRRGDALIGQLRALGERICARSSSQAAPEQNAADLRELNRIDAELLEANKHFSASLGHASRQTGQLLTGTILVLALLLTTGSIWFVMRSLRSQIAQRSALLQANTRWDLAADAAGVGVFVWRSADDSLQFDRRARQLYGLDTESTGPIPRAEFSPHMHPDDRNGFQRLIKTALLDAAPMRVRYRLLKADGSIRHIEAIGTLSDDGPDPAQRQMFGVLRDVTDEEAAAQLRIERDAAERSAQARSEFLSRLSHELRTPLNAVLGLAQLLDIDTNEALTTQQRRRVKLILDSGWHLLHLVDDVLDITGIDAGRLAVSRVPTDLRAVLRASLSLVEPERLRCGVELVDRWPATLPEVLADPKRLQQVFVNLLSNACKYNRRGGKLTLGHRDTMDQVRLSFEDEGSGIDPAQLADLFQPFKRLAATANVPGTGLGLVVVKLLVEQMQGRVEVASHPGRGSTFTVCLRKT